MDPEEKEMEQFLLEITHMNNIPLSAEMQSIFEELQSSVPFPAGVETTLEAAPAPPPPLIVPVQPMLNNYPQIVENLNAVNAVYMEAALAPPPQLMAPPAVYNQHAPAVYNQGAPAIYNQGAPAIYNQGAPAVYGQAAPAVYGQAAPAVYGQAAPAVYGQGAPAVYGQGAPAVYGQAAPAFYGQAPPVFQLQCGQNTMQTTGYLYTQPLAQNQGQYLPSQQLVFLPGAPVACAPQQQSQFMQMLLPNPDITLPVVGVVNGEVVYGMPTGPSQASAPANSIPAKPEQPKVKEEYVKRPPNAFMLFLKEQRPNVMAEVKLLTNDTINSATVNSILGQRWKTMTNDQQGKYFHEAKQQRDFHNMQHPGWSPGQNYGKKKKRDRKKAPKNTKESGLVDNKQGITGLMGPPISKVAEETVPHFFSLYPIPPNSAAPKHQQHSDQPECPTQQ